MKNCGRRFHNEVAKYRFLNELIKVVSPKVSSVAMPCTQSELMIRALDLESDYCLHCIAYANILLLSIWATVRLRR